jgi:hypothetical protein
LKCNKLYLTKGGANMNEAKIYSEKADKLYWRYQGNYAILILSTLLDYRDTLDRYAKLKTLGKIQTKKYNSIKKHIDELEKNIEKK